MTTAKLATRNILTKAAKGFTLIELLIVIVIIGVLAAVILIAINPVEQIARANDSGRISDIAEIGHAVQAYYANQQKLPTVGNTYQTALFNAGEISQAVVTVPPSTNTVCDGATGGTQGGICYVSNGTTNFLVWTTLDSTSNSVKAANAVAGTPCAAGTVPAAIYDSSQGKAGLACLPTNGAPAGGVSLH